MLMVFVTSFEDVKARQSKNDLQGQSLVFCLSFFVELVFGSGSSYQKRRMMMMMSCAVRKLQGHSMLLVSKT